MLAVLLVAVILISNTLFRGARLDLTQNHLYTLSQGTKNILSGIDEPIHLYLFFSDKGTQDLPQLRTYAQRVREMLEEMSARAGGKIHLDVIDPLPFSEDEDRATGFGLQAVPTGQGGENIFFGLAGTNSTNGKSVIPFLQPDKEAFLEYDVAKLIHELTMTKKPAVGLISGLPMSASFDPQTRQMREPWAIEQQLQQLFDVRQLSAASLKAIDKDISVLVLVHPKTSDRRRAVRDRSVRAARRSSAGIRRSARRGRRIRRRSEQSAGGDVRRQVLGPAEAVQGLGRRVRPEQDRARSRACAADQHGAGRAAGARSRRFSASPRRDLNPNDVTTANLDTHQHFHGRILPARRRIRRTSSCR